MLGVLGASRGVGWLAAQAGAPEQEPAGVPAKPRSPLTERNPERRAGMSGIRVAGGLGSTRGTSTDPGPQDDPRAPSAATDL